MLSYLLIFRFLLFNILIVGLMAVLWTRGVIEPLFAQDITFITFGIVALFAVSWAACWRLAWRASRQLNALKHGAREFATDEDRRKAFGKMEWIKDVSAWLTTLGLLGTVIGFAIAIGGIDQTALSSASGLKQTLGPLLAGMRVAINTTIVGAVLGLWNEINARLLFTASNTYWADRISAGWKR